MIRTLSFLTIGMLGLLACSPLPKKKLRQVQLAHTYDYRNDSLVVSLDNPLPSPLYVKTSSEDSQVQNILKNFSPITLNPFQDSVFAFSLSYTETEPKIRISSTFGNPFDSMTQKALVYPFPKGRKYKIIQGYNGSFSHNSDFSRYAIDFSLKVGDTICAAADGYVVGVIEGYKHGGKDRKWRDYANFITLYHPEMNILTQYVHLVENGSLVEVGDTVNGGDPIGLSGLTGFTSISHLHFNVLSIEPDGSKSIPADFQNGVSGEELKKGIYVSH
ncbi:MAG: M23 family metallopeptidase [Bacteroidota bacterium]